MFSQCVCVHDGLCFRYIALGNHRSVPQQTTSYATGQTVCTFISDVHTMIGGWCKCLPLVCIYGHMHGVVELYLVWECEHICLRMLLLQPYMSRFYLFTVTHVLLCSK